MNFGRRCVKKRDRGDANGVLESCLGFPPRSVGATGDTPYIAVRRECLTDVGKPFVRIGERIGGRFKNSSGGVLRPSSLERKIGVEGRTNRGLTAPARLIVVGEEFIESDAGVAIFVLAAAV